MTNTYERNIVKVSDDAPLELLGPLGLRGPDRCRRGAQRAAARPQGSAAGSSGTSHRFGTPAASVRIGSLGDDDDARQLAGGRAAGDHLDLEAQPR